MPLKANEFSVLLYNAYKMGVCHSSKESHHLRVCVEDYETEEEAEAQRRAVVPLTNE
jgi:hypothetical protein